MCLDHGSFLLVTADEEKSLENIATILLSGKGLKMVDIFGKIAEVEGAIGEIDLLNKRIVLA